MYRVEYGGNFCLLLWSWLNKLVARSPSVRIRGQLPRGGSLSLCTFVPILHSPARARIVPAVPRRRTGERHTNKQNRVQAAIRPREAVAKEYNCTQGRAWRGGGSPEGADVSEGKSAAPSGALCFFLTVEKEEAARRTINKGKVNRTDGKPLSLRYAQPAPLQRGACWSASLRQCLKE